MIARIYIGCCARDLWLARISVASIRFWYPEVPITLLCDFASGKFSTTEIERHWSVEVMISDPRYSSWGYSKLQLLFRSALERFFFVDADTVCVGPVLDPLHARTEQFIVSPDLVPDPNSHPIMPMYFDFAALQAIDPNYRFPGYVFNSGQFVATSGLLRAEDFATFVDWKVPPKSRRPDVFFSADQGLLNYVLARKAQAGEITLGTATLYFDGRSDEAAQLNFQPSARTNPFLIHWPGEKPAVARRFPRGDILRFFEDRYYARIPRGAWKRAGREALRRVLAARRNASVKLSRAVPADLRRRLKQMLDR